ncbi:hypothetical protein QZH41_011090, partial [Actinostola sp. cb2023]
LLSFIVTLLPCDFQVRVVGLIERPSSNLMVHRSMELRVLEQHRISVSEHDIKDLPKSRDRLREVVSLWKGQKPDANSNETVESLANAFMHLKEANAQPQNAATARLRFRHAALSNITRNRRMSKFTEKDCSESQKAFNALTKSFVGSKFVGAPPSLGRYLIVHGLLCAILLTVPVIFHTEEPGLKFNIGTQSYSVVKSAKHIDVDILLSTNKKRLSISGPPNRLMSFSAPYDPSTQIDELKLSKLQQNGNLVRMNTVNGIPINAVLIKPTNKENLYTRSVSPSDSEHSAPIENHRTSVCSVITETTYSVDYETRDGNAKHGRDYNSVKGTMGFKSNQGTNDHRFCLRHGILRIPIIQHNDYTKNKEFYVIKKNPTASNGIELGEISLTRVTIIDDDEPGEFTFEQGSYHANFMTQDVTCAVVRRRGCDGHVTIKYRTLNGTAIGGLPDDNNPWDFEQVNDANITFQHGETSKMLVIRINPESLNKNFIVILYDPSPGATLGEKTATVIHISSDVDDIVDRVANIITLEDNQSLSKSWRSQFEDNSVNVFLGLASTVGHQCLLPCCHQETTFYCQVTTFRFLFWCTCYCSCCIVILFLKGELGGSTTHKWLTGLFLVFLWCVYVILSSLMAYGYIPNTI